MSRDISDKCHYCGRFSFGTLAGRFRPTFFSGGYVMSKQKTVRVDVLIIGNVGDELCSYVDTVREVLGDKFKDFRYVKTSGRHTVYAVLFLVSSDVPCSDLRDCWMGQGQVYSCGVV